jgi:hypothetical protein
MSTWGRFLLNNCDNECGIDLSKFHNEFSLKGVHEMEVKVYAIRLGLSLITTAVK